MATGTGQHCLALTSGHLVAVSLTPVLPSATPRWSSLSTAKDLCHIPQPPAHIRVTGTAETRRLVSAEAYHAFASNWQELRSAGAEGAHPHVG